MPVDGFGRVTSKDGRPTPLPEYTHEEARTLMQNVGGYAKTFGQDAQDIVQDAMVVILQSARQVPDTDNYFNMVHGARKFFGVRFETVDGKVRNRLQERLEDAAPDMSVFGVNDTTSERELIDKIDFEKFLLRQPEKYIRAFVGAEILGENPEKIAFELGVSPQTLRNWLVHTRQFLERCFYYERDERYILTDLGRGKGKKMRLAWEAEATHGKA